MAGDVNSDSGYRYLFYRVQRRRERLARSEMNIEDRIL
jgi:hypothetical protein